ncbi:hypothetical protein KKF91_07655 [Myxococcota bacterium]|nr:hypothetical protein [Myxococcota bacterium]MBU1430418.1 hypothetical protein [Myxococcota bacterium]MBU1896868.1 hypothetical protein [Myxococcota bacterium]
MRARGALMLSLLLGWAQANPLEIYGLSARGQAMGNAQTAAVEDYTATFYNPGALTRPKKVGVGVGLLTSFPELRIDRSYATPQQREAAHITPPDYHGVHLGALFPLGGVFDNRFALGAAFYLPLDNLTLGQSLDARKPQFYRYQNLPDRYALLLSLAVEIVKGVSVGAGVQGLGDLVGETAMDVRASEQVVEAGSVSIDFRPTMSPTAGVLIGPFAGLRIGASWRGEIQTDFELPTHIVIDDILIMDVLLKGVVLYHPHTFNVGLAYDLAAWGLLISADMSYALWSRAPDPAPFFEFNMEGDALAGLGLEERLDIHSGPAIDLYFRDVAQWQFGLEHRPFDVARVRAGYAYRPSPAPVPTGPYNYIDNDAHILSLGLGLRYPDPLEIRRNPIQLDVVYQLTRMAEVTVRQDAGAQDLVGDFTAGGAIHSVGITFLHEL